MSKRSSQAEAMRDESASGLDLPNAPVLVEPEQVAEDSRFSEPLGTLEDVHGCILNTSVATSARY